MSEKLISADDVLKYTVLAGEIRNPYMEVVPAFYIREAPAVDAVEVSIIRDWLYEIAGNNISTEKERQFSVLCEELISRLDGLRNFARERREDNE